MRGVVTALQWFNPIVRAFSPDNVVAAMQFLGALEGEAHVVWTEAKRLQTSLGAPASKSINLTTSLLTAMIARAQRSLLSGAGPARSWRSSEPGRGGGGFAQTFVLAEGGPRRSGPDLIASCLMFKARMLAATAAMLVLSVAPGSHAGVTPGRDADRVALVVDRDDDDADGTPDAEQLFVPPSPELVPIPHGTAIPAGATFALRGAVRLLADGHPLAPGAAIPQRLRRLELQSTGPGRAEIDIGGHTLQLGALEIRALDGEGNAIDLTRSHASLQRTPPARIEAGSTAFRDDSDALRFVVAGAGDDLPGTVSILSLGADGQPIDVLTSLPLAAVACPKGSGPELSCGATPPIRAAADDVDRGHPLVKDRSIRAELGGALTLTSPRGDKLQMIRVGGPRSTPVGPIERLRARLRVFLVRLGAHGPPPLGGEDAEAIDVARTEVERANALWGACGVSFGPPAELDVRVVDPPPAHLLAVGCDHGFPASGGAIHVRVDGRDVKVPILAGTRPAAAARVVAAAVRAAGFAATVSDNPTIGAGAFGSADVLVRRKGGALATIDVPASGPLSSDATLSACLGRVDIEDGLQHFGDVDAIAGTVEERALIKAFDDGDPSTIEIFLLPSFAGGGRIGESFISADGGSVRNVLLEDRAGIRAGRASFALAHELGHILLDDPGHPDDFGVDTPTRLMDADAASLSAFGPRRLLVEECARAVRQSGPAAPVPLLRSWPLGPLGASSSAARTGRATRPVRR